MTLTHRSSHLIASFRKQKPKSLSCCVTYLAGIVGKRVDFLFSSRCSSLNFGAPWCHSVLLILHPSDAKISQRQIPEGLLWVLLTVKETHKLKGSSSSAQRHLSDVKYHLNVTWCSEKPVSQLKLLHHIATLVWLWTITIQYTYVVFLKNKIFSLFGRCLCGQSRWSSC